MLAIVGWLAACGARIEVDTGRFEDTDPADTAGDADTDTGEPDTGDDTDTADTGDTGDTADTDPLPWRHTATVDGSTGEYGSAESFTASAGATWFVTWDDTHLFVAVRHTDVATGGPLHWVLVYLGDGASGTTTGVQFGTQQPTLPTRVGTLVRWKADGSWDGLDQWDGTGWTTVSSWLGTDGSAVAEAGDVVELAIPLATVGATSTVVVHGALLYEGSGSESTYAPLPSGSFTDGYDPDFTRWYAFDLVGWTAPGDHAPQPW